MSAHACVPAASISNAPVVSPPSNGPVVSAPSPGVSAPSASASAAVVSKAPVYAGAPTLPAVETDADDTADGPDTWDDLEWELESSDYDWEESDEEEALGINVRDIDAYGGSDEDGDGDTDYHAIARVAVAGLDEHEIELDEDDEPLQSENPDVLRLTDKTVGDVSTFVADQEFNGFTIEYAGDTTTVEFSDDDTILVDGESYDGSQAAAEALLETPVGKGMSVHSLAFLEGVLMRRTPEETRGAPTCNPPTTQGDTTRVYSLRSARYQVQQVADPASERPLELVRKLMSLRREPS